MNTKRFCKTVFLSLTLLAFLSSCSGNSDWRTASRESSKLAPLPSEEKEALVYVFAAKTFSWRGLFSVHSWIAVKEKNASTYTTFHVLGWRVNRGQSAVVVEKDVPDRLWYGARPEIIQVVKGVEAERLIPQISLASSTYPYPKTYRAWPGPNSNTFVSHILRNVSGLQVELPPNAIGKDYLVHDFIFSRSETKTGGQMSLYGLLSFTMGINEGIELNLLGLTFGIDVKNPALKLPLIGRLGMRDTP